MSNTRRTNYLCFIEYLHSLHHPTYEKDGRLYQWPLENMVNFCHFLGDPQNKLKIIHIAGTNGKGSCVSLIATYLMALGYKVGTYTSPELFDIKERIRINGVVIPKSVIEEFYEVLSRYKISGKAGNLDTYSQVFISLAFYYFNKTCVDYAVIETGIGGTLDPTNIATPILTIITSIGLDHTELLGNTILEIAKAKSGIIKNNIPVIVGPMSDYLTDYFKMRAQQNDAPFYCASSFDWRDDSFFPSPLQADYQKDNIKTCYAALMVLSSLGHIGPFNQEKYLSAIDTYRELFCIHGRWEYVSHSPDIIIDICDNELGAKRVFESIKYIYGQGHYKRLVIIFGLTGPSKLGMLKYFPQDAIYYYTQSHSFIEPSEVRKVFGVPGNCYQNPENAIEHYLSTKDRNDLVLIMGSIHIASVAYRYFNGNNYTDNEPSIS